MDLQLATELRAQQAELLDVLKECTGATGEPLRNALRKLRPLVERHLDSKDRLYVAIRELCASTGDAGGAQIAGIFETNMRVLGTAIRRFFTDLEAPRSPDALAQSFRTIEGVLRNRLDTESKAVLPIFERQMKKLQSAAQPQGGNR